MLTSCPVPPSIISPDEPPSLVKWALYSPVSLMGRLRLRRWSEVGSRLQIQVFPPPELDLSTAVLHRGGDMHVLGTLGTPFPLLTEETKAFAYRPSCLGPRATPTDVVCLVNSPHWILTYPRKRQSPRRLSL